MVESRRQLQRFLAQSGNGYVSKRQGEKNLPREESTPVMKTKNVSGLDPMRGLWKSSIILHISLHDLKMGRRQAPEVHIRNLVTMIRKMNDFSLTAYSSICRLLFVCFFIAFSLTDCIDDPAAYITDDVSINCGSAAVSAARSGRNWVGDKHPRFRSSLQLKGTSAISSVIRGGPIPDYQVPYNTARISRSEFSSTFLLNPGPKFIRLHFNPTAYKGFERGKDLFDVVAGPFTLLGNFSASLTGDALGLSYFAKEYCLNVDENQLLSISFSPAIVQSRDAYAFINGIEIIPVTLGHSCYHGGGIGVRVIGQESQLSYIDSGTALEMVLREKVGWDPASLSDDFGTIFGMRETVRKEKGSEMTWKIPVDVGFRYLVRLHFNRVLKMMKNGPLIFKAHINEVVACTNVDIFQETDNVVFLKHDHMDFIVLVRGRKEGGKRHLSLQSCDEFNDGRGTLTGFEIFKLSNFDNSLAVPNPLPSSRDSSSRTIQYLFSIIGHRNVIGTLAIVSVSLVNIIIHKLRGILTFNNTEEENKPSARAERFCRRFSLSEIQLGTKNFSDAHLIGKGGFGKVYKCLIDNGSLSVAIKRLKSNSRQGAHEFLTEIETLSELRHVNLVSLIGYCNEHREMILVYDYMPNGTLADHLYKLERNGTGSSSLTWKRRLDICIGAGRGLDYLHTGNAVIHRDVKVSNILLDEDFRAKVSDFGLVKYEDKHNPKGHVSTKVKGTFGYFDPNYFTTGKLTRKSDVYAFGVVLLEVLCGRPALDISVSMDEQILTKWARDKICKGEVDLIVASSLREEILPDSLKTFVQVVERCLEDEPNKRPTMAHVVMQLESALEHQEITICSEPIDITSVAPCNDETNLADSGQLTVSFTDGQTFTPPPKEQSNHYIDNAYPSSGGNRRKATRYKPSWRPWDAFFNRFKYPKKSELSVPGAKLTKFDWKTIVFGTNQFSPAHLIGRGGFGSVYKVLLPSGQIAAVNRLSPFSITSHCQFENEILLLQNLQHQNIVKLLGYCIHGEERMLVYEFMENGGLDSFIFDEAGRIQLQWGQRFKIILGIARGLLYLHQDSGSRIIHRDPNPSNILLDKEMNPKISDFGAAKSLREDQSYVSTRIVGTFGYICPEAMTDGIFSTASDLYVFGVAVLEIVSGKRSRFSQRVQENFSLVEFVRTLWDDGKTMDLVDESIKDVNMDEAIRCIQVGILCTGERRRRPTASEVLDMLHGK